MITAVELVTLGYPIRRRASGTKLRARMISLRKVSKTYDSGANYAVEDLTLEVSEGEFVVLLGESGCGKTTTLKMINRLIEPSAGTIMVAGEDTSAVDPVMLRRKIGYIFQEIGLFPHMSVAENVGAVPRLLGWRRVEIESRTRELLELVGLDPERYRNRKPSELSGGQQQRVGVARALAAGPKVMLMDEPFGALDPITRTDVQDEVGRLRERLNLTVVMVTHDMMEAVILADRIVIMEGGVVVAQGTPRDLLHDPGHPYAEKLLATPREQAEILDRIMRREEGA